MNNKKEDSSKNLKIIFWIIFSIFLLIFFLLKRRKRKEAKLQAQEEIVEQKEKNDYYQYNPEVETNHINTQEKKIRILDQRSKVHSFHLVKEDVLPNGTYKLTLVSHDNNIVKKYFPSSKEKDFFIENYIK